MTDGDMNFLLTMLAFLASMIAFAGALGFWLRRSDSQRHGEN